MICLSLSNISCECLTSTTQRNVNFQFQVFQYLVQILTSWPGRAPGRRSNCNSLSQQFTTIQMTKLTKFPLFLVFQISARLFSIPWNDARAANHSHRSFSSLKFQNCQNFIQNFQFQIFEFKPFKMCSYWTRWGRKYCRGQFG